MEPFNWKKHFDAAIELLEDDHGFQSYRITNETGDGNLTVLSLFPGVQILQSDLHMLRCITFCPEEQDVVEVNYCIEGRYECVVNERYCFLIGAGDFSVGTAGRREAGGSFPLRRYRGLTILIQPKLVEQRIPGILNNLGVDFTRINMLAARKPRYFVLQASGHLEETLSGLADGFAEKDPPYLRLKMLELLLFLNRPERLEIDEAPAYLSRKQAVIAEEVRNMLMEDLASHVTIRDMAEFLHVGPTALKTAFKSVYGTSIYQYQKDYRLQESQRLLRDTPLSFTEIATAIGYGNAGKFSSAFKAKFGITPTAFRRSSRQYRPPSAQMRKAAEAT